MRLRKRALVLATVALMVVGPRAWGDPRAGSPGGTVTVSISGMKFNPEVLVAPAGQAIVFKNEDLVPHTVTAADKSFDSGAIIGGASWEYTPAKSGLLRYSCTFHPSMSGTLDMR